VLDPEKPKDVEQIMKEANLGYPEVEMALVNLVINNLAISQEIESNPTFIDVKPQGPVFLENNQEVTKKVGETIAGWELLSYSQDVAVMKKNDIITTFAKGSTLEYLYVKTHKEPVERDLTYLCGMSSQGVYKGRVKAEPNAGEKLYSFQNVVIPKKTIRYGLAIFQDIAQEMDFMAIVVSGLVDPLVRRKGQLYVENEAFMIGYAKVKEENSPEEVLNPLYQRWVILSSRESKRK
jgi:hypothetical protein